MDNKKLGIIILIVGILLASAIYAIKAREDSGAGLILDYLWKIYIEARNFSILIHSRDFEKVNLRNELVIL